MAAAWREVDLGTAGALQELSDTGTVPPLPGLAAHRRGASAHGRGLDRHLQLHQEGEVVGRDVGVGAAQHLVLSKPLLVVGAQLPQDPEAISGVEDVVNYALEVISVTHTKKGRLDKQALSERTRQVSDIPFSSPPPPPPPND